jgi:Arc/MetJ family transcription regulator
MVTHMKTTIELSDPLLEEAKRVAARDKTTLRALVEAGLRSVLRERRRRGRFVLRDAAFGGDGLAPEFADADWDRIRGAAYEGRGD